MLLDTHVLLWVLGAPERLLPEVAKRITDPALDVHVSAATAYEISIQYALGKLRLPARPHTWLPQAVRRLHLSWLAIEPDDALLLGCRLTTAIRSTASSPHRPHAATRS
ncbi:MAG: PIN domain nuclease [Planctomycetota bacterium]|nr:MAG: PIN domain nuclease [Planctomycetota bacterium]